MPGVPPVAAMTTGLPVSAVLSIRSKKDLNSPLYEAVKTGVTAISPSAPVTASIAFLRPHGWKPLTRWPMMSTARSRSSTTWTSTWRSCSAASFSRAASASRSASSRVDEGLLSPAATATILSGAVAGTVIGAPRGLWRRRGRR